MLSKEGTDADLSKMKSEWHEVQLKSTVQNMVARLSSRVFLGEELCRNQEWLDLTVEATINFMKAGGMLRMFPLILRPLVNEILPVCRLMRADQYVNPLDSVYARL